MKVYKLGHVEGKVFKSVESMFKWLAKEDCIVSINFPLMYCKVYDTITRVEQFYSYVEIDVV